MDVAKLCAVSSVESSHVRLGTEPAEPTERTLCKLIFPFATSISSRIASHCERTKKNNANNSQNVQNAHWSHYEFYSDDVILTRERLKRFINFALIHCEFNRTHASVLRTHEHAHSERTTESGTDREQMDKFIHFQTNWVQRLSQRVGYVLLMKIDLLAIAYALPHFSLRWAQRW